MTATESYLPNIETYTPKPTRKQFFLTVLVVLGILSLIPIVCAKHTPVMPKESQVTVQPKETLWDIVSEEYPSSVNPWDAVNAIEKRNGLKSAGDLQAGYTYYLPEVK